jgi:hypothetical protein
MMEKLLMVSIVAGIGGLFFPPFLAIAGIAFFLFISLTLIGIIFG